MIKENKISLITAILININIMIGVGVFINPSPITIFLETFGFLSYLISAFLLLPIVLTIAKLTEKKAVAGGLYIYNKETLGNSLGFLSGWSYFLGKATSAGLLVNTFVTFFHGRISILQNFSILTLDAILIFVLMFLNILGLNLGGKIQYIFASTKFIPLFFIIFTSFSIFNTNFFILTQTDFKNLFFAIPVAIYTLISFEIICSIGHMVKNPEKNIKRAILYSFFIVVTITTLVQIALFFALGKELTTVSIPVFLLCSKIFSINSIIPSIINSLVFASILGGAFSLISSNCWNLYALSNDNNFPFKKFITKINKNNVPYISMFIQGILALILLAISQNQVNLQYMVVFGVTIAYLLSSISLFKILKESSFSNKIIPILAILSSSYLIFICISNISRVGISIPFLTIFLIGISLAIFKKLYHSTKI